LIQIYNPRALIFVTFALVAIWLGVRTYAKMGRGRRWLVTALRALVILLLVGVLLNVYVWWTDKSRDLCVYYVVDLSTSMEPHREAACRVVLDSMAERPRDAWAGLIVFHSRAVMAAPAGPGPDRKVVAEAIRGTGGKDVLPRAASIEEQETNIAEAIRLAVSSFPSDMAKRICLVSDLNETAGTSLAEAAAARRAGVDIVTLQPDMKIAADVSVDRVRLPDDVKLSRAFNVGVDVASSFHDNDDARPRVEVRLYRNHVCVDRRQAQPRRGVTSFEFRQRLDRGGRFLYEARVVVHEKQPPENDRGYAYLELKGMPRVLAVSDDPAEGRVLRRALESGHMDVEIRTSRGLPTSMLDLQDFAAVLVGDVPASAMTSNQMKLLHDYVREFAGTVVMAGGEHALSAGGYAGTIVEEFMPVRCSFTEKEAPTSAIVFVTDSSRSIVLREEDFAGKKRNFTHLLLRSAVDTLTDRDRMGVVGFSGTITSPTWYMALQKVVDRSRLRMTRIAFRDYSHLFMSMNLAYQRLTKIHATNKGIILVTDGYVEPGPDYAQLAMQLAAGDVTVSCVAVGKDANKELLRRVARWGNGRYYEAESEKDATKLFQREIEEFARGVVIERPTEMLPVKASEMFQGVDIHTSPTLFGYVRVQPKLAAETLVVTQQSKDPLLVTWPFGAGRVTVLATDLRGKWTQLWVDEWQDQFALFLRNLLRRVEDTEAEVEYVPRAGVRGWELTLEADGLDPANRFVNGKPPRAGLYPLGEKGQVFSEAARQDVRMEQVGPGLYRARHKVNRSGVYLLKVSRSDGGGVRTAGAVVAMNQEAASLLPNRDLENKLCAVTDGSAGAKPAEVFALTGAARKRPHDLAGMLLVIACVVFALDVLVRRWPALAATLRGRGRS